MGLRIESMFHPKTICYRRVGVNADLSASNTNRIIVNKELDYSHFLYFSVSHRTNRFVYPHKDRYSKKQEETHSLIKSLHDSGLGYRKISRHLNKQKITTHKGKKWGVSGNSVHSVLKKNIEIQRKLKILDKEYEMVWSRMKIKYEIK